MSYFDEAKTKLEEIKDVSGAKEKAMAASVSITLIEFCQHSEEFAQAVVQGGTFKDCMTSVAKGTGDSISDIEAYKKAVQFYFPGSDVKFEMHIMMSEYDVAPEVRKNVVIDLGEFFN